MIYKAIQSDLLQDRTSGARGGERWEKSKTAYCIERKDLNTFCYIILSINMGKAKWIVIFILLVIAVIWLYYNDKSMVCNAFNSVINSSISSKICGSTNHTSPTTSKILGMEANAIKSSSPIAIKHWEVFGSGLNITKPPTRQEQAYFYDNFSVYEIDYNGIYFPVSVTIGEILENSTFTNASLIGQKIYLNFITNNYKNASALYMTNKIYTKGNMFYWVLGQDTGISNSSAITHIEVLDNKSLSITELNGVIFLNGTGALSPRNPAIYDLLHKSA